MRSTVIALGTAAMFCLPLAAQAQDDSRYRLEKSGEGFVRMDTRTGQMSICESLSGQLVCKPAADERDAYSGQVEELEKRIEALEGRLAAIEKSPPSGVGNLPSEQEFEQTLGFMEKFFRRFMDVIRDFDRDLRQEEPAESGPQRT